MAVETLLAISTGVKSIVDIIKVLTNIAQIQYISRNNPDNEDAGDLILYDYASQSHLTENQLVSCALDSGYELNKHIDGEEIDARN